MHVIWSFSSGGGDGTGKYICKSFVKMIDSAALTSSLNTWILHLGTKYIRVLLFSVPLGKTFELYVIAGVPADHLAACFVQPHPKTAYI